MLRLTNVFCYMKVMPKYGNRYILRVIYKINGSNSHRHTHAHKHKHKLNDMQESASALA